MSVKIGDMFVRQGGRKRIKILGEEDGVFTCQLDDEQQFIATKDTVSSWVKVKTIDLIPSTRKRNTISLKNVCIDVLKTTMQPMTATEIYKYICEHNLFQFSEKAKTPANTIHARIREYMKNDRHGLIKYHSCGKGKFFFDLDATIPF